MLKGIYKTAAGMLPQLARIDAVANNLANSRTSGFKREVVFAQELGKAQQKQGEVAADWQSQQVNLLTDYTQGALEQTGNSLDLAIDGDAFFVVSTPDGEMYTRNGSFTLSSEGQLVTKDGYAVLAENGEITVDGDEFTVSRSGEMMLDQKPLGTLQLVKFERPFPLVRTQSGLFGTLPGAPGPQSADDFALHQGMIESSNVELVTEMVQMMESYRNFEAGQRMIQIQDESLDKAINRLGSVSR